MSILLLTLAISLLSQADEKAILQAIEKLKAPEAGERHAGMDALRKIGPDAVPLILKTLENEHPGLALQVETLVKKLSSREWKERDEAMKGLVRLGRVAKKLLEEQEGSADPEVAWRIKTALAEIQEKGETEEKQDQSRNALLCSLLGDIGDPRGVPILLRSMAVKNDPTVQLKAVEALSKLRAHLTREQADEASDRILEILEATKAPLVKSLLIKALGPLKSRGCVFTLVSLLKNKSEKNVNLKRSVIAALAEIDDPRGLKAIIEALFDEEIYLRHGAAVVLASVAGESFGYDPRASDEENKSALEKFRKWWEKKYSKEWED